MSLSARKLVWNAATRLKLLAHRQWPAWWRFRAASASRVAHTTTTTSRRLLLLTWEFPPLVTGGVYRPLSFVRHASTSGWQVEVVCGPAPSTPSEAGRYLEGLLPEEVPVTRVSSDSGPDPWPLPRIDGGILNALSLFEAAEARIRPGEGGVILASGPPFANFVAGLWLARRTGWKLVLDYRDEWTQAPFKFVDKAGDNPDWEKRCLERADMVIFTTPSQLAHAERHFLSLAHSQNTVVYNGWEPGDFAQAPSLGQPDPGSPITLAYLGNLGAMAAPDAFLNTLAAALGAQPELGARLKVLLVGHKRPDALEALRAFPFPEVIELVDSVPKQEACGMMQRVDGLLLLNPVGLRRYIQGKLYEYIASGTPVLVFGAGGEMGIIVDGLEAGTTVAESDAAGLAQALYELRARRNSNPAQRRKWLASRERAVLARVLYRQLDMLIDTSLEKP